jgi:hypothetical protein
VYQWCGFKSRRGKNKNLTALKSNSHTVWFNFQIYIYILFNQRFIVWKLNNTNVDWKNTATVLNCVSARWQDEEDTPPISIFWASPCFAGDSKSYNPLWNLERSTGHVPHTIANIYYSELSGYFKESKPSSESVPIQEPTPLVCKEDPRLRTWKYKSLWYHRRK